MCFDVVRSRRVPETDAQVKLVEVEQLQLEISQLKTKLSVMNVANHALGFDRHHKRYWCFGSAGGLKGSARLFVEDADTHSLLCLDVAEALSKLIDAMNVRGVREMALQKGLSDTIVEMTSQIKLRKQREKQFLTDVLAYATHALNQLSGKASSGRGVAPLSVSEFYDSNVRIEYPLMPLSPFATALLTATSLSVPAPKHTLGAGIQDIGE